MILFQQNQLSSASAHLATAVTAAFHAAQDAAKSEYSIDIRAFEPIRSLSDRVRALRELPLNWAGRGTGPITPLMAFRVTQVFAIFARLGFRIPAVVPAVDGTVQLEWRTQRCNVEVHVSEDVTDVYIDNLENNQSIATTEINDAHALMVAARHVADLAL